MAPLRLLDPRCGEPLAQDWGVARRGRGRGRGQ
jgi:hypothetical protein